MTRRLRTVRLCSLTAVVALVLLASGCSLLRSSGDQTTQTRQIAGVAAVRLLTSGDLTITTGGTESLTVTAGANDLTGLTSQVIDGTLILDNKDSIGSGGISYALTVGPLDRLEVSGSGNATGIGTLRGDSTVLASGSGSVELTGLAMTGVVVDLSGSGGVTLGGTADTQQVTLSGSGGYDGSGLITAEADVEVDGSGSARVQVTDRLSATVNGSGDITYTGNPPQVDRSTSGSGDIVPG
jgi:hypothetical protein